MTAMEPQRSQRGALKVGLLAAGLVLGLGPTAALADSCTFQGLTVNGTVKAVLRETREKVTWSATSREAKATENGDLREGCGSLSPLVGTAQAKGQSEIPVLGTLPNGLPILGKGPTSAKFHIDTAASGRVTGELGGELDFTTLYGSPLCGGPCPFVLASGTWSTQGNDQTGGGFGGVALVAFDATQGCPTALSPTGWCYLDPTATLTGFPVPGGTLVPLDAGNFSEKDGLPEAVFIVTLFQ
jgi:hypothetical protein